MSKTGPGLFESRRVNANPGLKVNRGNNFSYIKVTCDVLLFRVQLAVRKENVDLVATITI